MSLRQTVETYAAAVSRGDLQTAAGLIDEGDEVLVIGTDPEEWWRGRETVVGVYRAQQAEMGTEVSVSSLDLELAEEQGDAGWFAGRIHIQAPGGAVTARVSGVGRRRGDAWRLVHIHVSVGVENEDTLGIELPTAG